jgi:hypothetical protein
MSPHRGKHEVAEKSAHEDRTREQEEAMRERQGRAEEEQM